MKEPWLVKTSLVHDENAASSHNWMSRALRWQKQVRTVFRRFLWILLFRLHLTQCRMCRSSPQETCIDHTWKAPRHVLPQVNYPNISQWHPAPGFIIFIARRWIMLTYVDCAFDIYIIYCMLAMLSAQRLAKWMCRDPVAALTGTLTHGIQMIACMLEQAMGRRIWAWIKENQGESRSVNMLQSVPTFGPSAHFRFCYLKLGERCAVMFSNFPRY